MLKPIIGIVIAVALMPPALADEYWVQYDYSKHECSIIKSATHLTETRFPWSPPNNGSKPKRALTGHANASPGATNSGPGNSPVDGSDNTSTPNGSNSTADVTSEATTPNATNNAAGAAGPPNETNSMSGSGATNNSSNNDFEKQLAATWKHKAELAKENHINTSTALIGSAMQSREQAEQEMQIMRMCGLRN